MSEQRNIIVTKVFKWDGSRVKIDSIKIGDEFMPIPGDNGRPKEERDAQNERIKNVAETGADVRKELTMNPPAPKEKTVMGEI